MVSVLADLTELEDSCTGIAAYNVAFDMKMLRGERRRLNVADRYGYRPDFCILQGSRKLQKFSKTPSLGEVVAAFFGELMTDTHKADADCAAAVRVFNHLRKAGVVEWKTRTPT